MQNAHAKPVGYGVKKADVIRERRHSVENTASSTGLFSSIRKMFK